MKRLGLILLLILNMLKGCQLKQERKHLVIIWKDIEINRLVDQVSKDNLKFSIKALQDFGTRYTYEAQIEVANYFYSLLKEQNLDVKYQGVIGKIKLITILKLCYLITKVQTNTL